MKIEEFAFDVFLSHNRAQKEWTRELARRLRDDGFRVWFDEWVLAKHAGSAFADLLAQGLETSRKVVLVWSPEFFANEWPEFEASVIHHSDPVGRKGRIVPLVHTKCEIPTKWGFRQWLSFVDCPHGSQKFEFAYQVLVHNLDPSRFVVPDSARYRPEKLVFASQVRLAAKLWRWTAYLAGFWTAFFLVGFIGGALTAKRGDIGSALSAWLIGTLFAVGLEVTITAAILARGLSRLRLSARRAALVASLLAFYYPLSWYTLWVLLHPEDPKELYEEVCQDAS